jgi:hypothetical protein
MARWQYLAMFNFQIDPPILEPLVPPGTELDSRNGQAIACGVGFRLLATRVGDWSIPFQRDFDEVNLRFYFRRRVGGEWQRGVVFAKEIVPRRLVASEARWAYGDNDVTLPMAHDIRMNDEGLASAVRYRWRLGDFPNGLSSQVSGPPASSCPEARLSTARNTLGYARTWGGATVECRVDHPRWQSGSRIR